MPKSNVAPNLTPPQPTPTERLELLASAPEEKPKPLAHRRALRLDADLRDVLAAHGPDSQAERMRKHSSGFSSALHQLAANLHPAGQDHRLTPGERRLQMEMPLLYQEDQNACGTTALAMSMSYLGVPADFRAIDRSIRFSGIGAGGPTAPSDIAAYARRAGLQAEVYNNGDLDAMAAHVEAGRPVTVVINRSSDGGAHYVNVIGVHRDDRGRITGLCVRDPNGFDHEYSVEEFDRMWRNTRVAGQVNGVGSALGIIAPTFNRCYIVLDRPDAAPLPSPSITGAIQGAPADATASAFAGLSGSVHTIRRGHVAEGCLQMVGCSINGAVSVATNLIGNVIGRNLQVGGDALLETAGRLWQGNVVEKLGAAFLAFFGAILSALGWLLSMIAGLAQLGSSALFGLLSRPAEAANTRDETRERILSERAHPPPFEVLPRASLGTKLAMMRTLLEGSRPNGEDQRAALVVFKAATPQERTAIVSHLGGREAFLAHFTDPNRADALALASASAP